MSGINRPEGLGQQPAIEIESHLLKEDTHANTDAKLAVARTSEGYKFIAMCLLGLVKNDDSKATIEKAVARFSAGDKLRVKLLSKALENAK